MASNLRALGSALLAMASNLRATASNLIAVKLFDVVCLHLLGFHRHGSKRALARFKVHSCCTAAATDFLPQFLFLGWGLRWNSETSLYSPYL